MLLAVKTAECIALPVCSKLKGEWVRNEIPCNSYAFNFSLVIWNKRKRVGG